MRHVPPSLFRAFSFLKSPGLFFFPFSFFYWQYKPKPRIWKGEKLLSTIRVYAWGITTKTKIFSYSTVIFSLLDSYFENASLLLFLFCGFGTSLFHILN